MNKKISSITLTLLAAFFFQCVYNMEKEESKRQDRSIVPEGISRGEILRGVSFVGRSTVAISSAKATYFINLDYKKHKRYEEKNSLANRIDASIYSTTPNKDYTVLITSNDWEVNRYDVQEKKQSQLRLRKGAKYFAFTSDNKLAVYYPYKKKIDIEGVVTELCRHSPFPYKPIVCHPYEKSLLLPTNSYTYCKLRIDDDDTCSHTTTTPLVKLEDHNNIVGITYNQDGRLLAVNEFRDGCLLYEDDILVTTLYYTTEKKPYDKPVYRAMAFNVNNMLILLTWNNIVQFWDCSLKQLIGVTALVSKVSHNIPDLDYQEHSLSVSPSGRRVAVIVNNQCFVIDVARLCPSFYDNCR